MAGGEVKDKENEGLKASETLTAKTLFVLNPREGDCLLTFSSLNLQQYCILRNEDFPQTTFSLALPQDSAVGITTKTC